MLHTFTRDRDEIAALEFQHLEDYPQFDPLHGTESTKYSGYLDDAATLVALFVNQRSDTLIVRCHGALPRKATVLPRFERLRTFLNTPYSSLYFGDPTLHLSEQVSLAWYTGWKELDLYPILARWVTSAAAASGASRIVFLGSSGGGFASLQISALIPGSMAIPLNPQTAIWKYQPSGNLAYARNYIKHIMPHLTPVGGVREIMPDVDWSEPLGDRASAISRYDQPVENYVFYAQNLNDVAHREDHYLLFRKKTETGPNRERIRYFTYEGQHTHTSPKPDIFSEIMADALSWFNEM